MATIDINIQLKNTGSDPINITVGSITLNIEELLHQLISFNHNSCVKEIAPEQAQLLTTEELAAYLKKSPSTIRNWKKSGEIPFQRVGRSIFFNLEDVLEAIEKETISKSKMINTHHFKKAPT
jgi:excisionase family DNA binding protein